jgi:cell shape-determining protein MreC
MYSPDVHPNNLVIILIIIIAATYFVISNLTFIIKKTMSDASELIQSKLDGLQATVDTLQAGFLSLKEQLAAAANGLTAEEVQLAIAKIEAIQADAASTDAPVEPEV